MCHLLVKIWILNRCGRFYWTGSKDQYSIQVTGRHSLWPLSLSSEPKIEQFFFLQKQMMVNFDWIFCRKFLITNILRPAFQPIQFYPKKIQTQTVNSKKKLRFVMFDYFPFFSRSPTIEEIKHSGNVSN